MIMNGDKVKTSWEAVIVWKYYHGIQLEGLR